MNRIEISMVQQYLEDCLFEPGLSWPKHYKESRIYSRWAVCEVIELLKSKPLVPAVIVIAEFMSTMDDCYENGMSKKARFMFSTARDVSKDILHLLK